jgi:hypothetical protein
VSSQALALDTPEPGPGDVQRAAVLAGVAGDLTILDLINELSWFRGTKEAPAAPWDAWRVFLKAVYGLPMDDLEVEIYRRHTGRREPPTSKVAEVWAGVGRRGRKSATMALMGVWEGGYVDRSEGLSLNERGRIPVIAKDKDDAKQIRGYVLSILDCKPASWLKHGEPTAEEIQLSTGIDLKIRACSLTAGRVKASPAALLDEVAFWESSDETTIPASAVLAGIRPSMSTFKDPLIVGMSSVYDKRGLTGTGFSSGWQRPRTCTARPRSAALSRRRWRSTRSRRGPSTSASGGRTSGPTWTRTSWTAAPCAGGR